MGTDSRTRTGLTRRRALQLIGIGAGAALAAACAPATTAPAATATVASAASSSQSVVSTPVATAAPATPVPTPKPTPFSLASMKDPLIDDHAHPIPPTQGDQSKYYDGIVDLMDRSNVAMTILHRNGEWTTGTNKWGADHDLWVKAAMERHPGRLLGYLAGFDPADPNALAYIRSQFSSAKPGTWKAIGELDLRNPGPQTKIPINSPNVLAIAKLAGDLGVPFVFHYNLDYGTSGPEAGMAEVEEAVSKLPGTTFIFAHNPAPPLMQKYQNLWGEVSLFNPQMPSQQILGQAAQMPNGLDRIVLCLTDLQSADLRIGAGIPAPISYAEGADRARQALAALTPDQRDKIAYKNLVRLLKLS